MLGRHDQRFRCKERLIRAKQQIWPAFVQRDLQYKKQLPIFCRKLLKAQLRRVKKRDLRSQRTCIHKHIHKHIQFYFHSDFSAALEC